MAKVMAPMSSPVSHLGQLIRTMQPVLNPGCYAFARLPLGAAIDADMVVAFVREFDGLSVVLKEEDAIRLGLPVVFRAAWITLTVHSDLEAVGLTAAFSAALARANIGCNVIAGTRHDHIFVPYAAAGEAMQALLRLQASADPTR